MAKNITNFIPGLFTASTSLTYKEIRYKSGHGEDRNGCCGAQEYGSYLHYVDRDHTPCHESNNRRVMKKTVNKTFGTEIFFMTSSGSTGGGCCCAGSAAGRSGHSFKISPRWSNNENDSDGLRLCIPQSNGCCYPDLNAGACSRPFYICVGGGSGVITGTHPVTGTGTSGQPGVFCGRMDGACGASGTCNWQFQNCCNYGALNSDGGFRHPCCTIPDTGITSCYTTNKTADELPFAACDAGYDCCRCAMVVGGSFEAGSCINRADSGMCGRINFSGSSIYKSQLFRSGMVSAHSHTICEMQMGGFVHRCNQSCLYGFNNNTTNYWGAGLATAGGYACGGPCCCGGPAAGGVVRIIYDDGNPEQVK